MKVLRSPLQYLSRTRLSTKQFQGHIGSISYDRSRHCKAHYYGYSVKNLPSGSVSLEEIL
jgi:hypothetical protein